MSDYESCQAQLGELIAWRDREGTGWRNEAATRFHLIDRLLKDVLGWLPEDIRVEEHVPDGYTDYELGHPSKQAVVEAKRESSSFELPAGWTAPSAPLAQLVTDGGPIGAAIEQALAYAQNRGIPVAAVCNGNQIIAYLASRMDGTPPIDGRASVYVSLEDMHQRFREFWNDLSKPGIASRHLVAKLQSARLPPPPAKLSERLPEYPGFKNRNPIAAELQILGGLFLEDILRYDEVEDEFLREAYCETGALSQYALVSRELLQAR